MIKSLLKKSKLLPAIALTFFIGSAVATVGFNSITTFEDQLIDLSLPNEPNYDQLIVPKLGAGDDKSDAEQVDVIRNGGFEERDTNSTNNGLALEWQPFSNGQAQFGWYDETWSEAVRGGEHAQLMEIFLVDGDVLDRVIAIHQTVDVTRDAEYALTIHALMRSDALLELRNKDEYEMNWGIDFSGASDYENVEKWVHMPLNEQFRIGSNGDFPDDQPLFYQIITGTIRTGDSDQITLFIRGVKKFATGTEVNFDVDDVSLIGPLPSTVTGAPSDTNDAMNDADLPTSGVRLPQNISIGAVLLGGLVLIVLGVSATANLLYNREET